MTFENFGIRNQTVADTTSTNKDLLFIDLLMENGNKARSSNPFDFVLIPELRIEDSQKSKNDSKSLLDNQQPAPSETPTPDSTPTNEVPKQNPTPNNEVPAPTPTPNNEVPTQTPTQNKEVPPANPTPNKEVPDPKNTPAPTQTEPTQNREVPPPTQIEPQRPQPQQVSPQPQTWGRFGRVYEVDTAGNAVYTVKSGDTYSAVARDVLEKRSGRKYDVKNEADRHEILKFSKELAAVNGVEWRRNNFVLIHPGDQIRIPGQKPNAPLPQSDTRKEYLPPKPVAPIKTESPKEPQVTAGAFAIQPQDKLYNLLQPPGFEGRPGQSWTKDLEVAGKAYDIEKRLLQSSKEIPNVGNEFVYSGEVESGFKSGTSFTAREIVDAKGRILSREIEYAEPLKLKVNLQSTQNQDLKIVAVKAFFDVRSGRYLTQCRTADGRVLGGQQASDGTVLWGDFQTR